MHIYSEVIMDIAMLYSVFIKVWGSFDTPMYVHNAL